MLLKEQLTRVLRVVKVKEKVKPKQEASGKKKQKGSSEKELSGKVAVVRMRGLTGVRYDIKKTMEMLRLYRNNYCVVLEANPNNVGMLEKVKDYVAYGEIDDKTYKMLVEKRGEAYNGRGKSYGGKVKYKRFVVIGNKKIKPFFRLSPPRGGLGRKGLKASFKQGGALGYRGKAMIKLIERMV